MHDDSRLNRWDRRTDLPLGVASLVFLGSYAVHVLEPGLPAAAHALFLSLMYTAWAMFAVDYAVRWRLSGEGRGFVRRHWLDTLVLVLPLLRPLRVVRTYESIQRRRGEPRLPLHARVALYSTLSISLLGFSGALAVYQVERSAPNASIRTFGDSLWWTCSTLSTVGYGDYVPVTTLGRFIAAGLMACGLALLGTVTGSFSSWMLQRFSRSEDERRPPEN
ncbi:MAG: two pore domain potassium channel family protein [Streptomyces sp.]|uniref:potassium channel family protein n=1 Tax=Streptomyces sp. TaxID=1931 RepID=UPI0025DC1135|nr:potassium channel family protein [Streptomyces sp.]MBW8796953.1 two pore domain potassium channel family protein [Streptomyces sp.]